MYSIVNDNIDLVIRAKKDPVSLIHPPICAEGTDLRYTNLDLSMADEALYMHKAGLTPMTILQILTSGSAKCLGIHKRTGSIKKGMEADFVVLSENPLLSQEALKNIRIIVNDGKIAISK